MEFAVRKTRSWTGFDATIYDTSGGLSEITAFANHGLIMHIGTPITVTCRCGRSVHRRLQLPGDFAIIAAGHPGAWAHDGPTALLIVNVTRSLIRSAAQAMNFEADVTLVQPLVHLKDPHVEHIGWALMAELETNEPVRDLYADSLGLALAAHLLRRYTQAVPRLVGGLSEHRLQRVLDYIPDHLAGDLSLIELAEIAEVSPSYLKVLFKQLAGMPVHQYVMRSRVEYAAGLLRSGHLTLTAVALEAGFADQSHMSRCMRRVAGVSPQTLRRAGGQS
ncbi:MAG: helix-turn-helix transcriptional regulator [Candidatus Eremiobacteraeota bacterium]|nr:helix-turn-helix transcriptional regulator [Candidatus Eremiobacteraeota bacterium]